MEDLYIYWCFLYFGFWFFHVYSQFNSSVNLYKLNKNTIRNWFEITSGNFSFMLDLLRHKHVIEIDALLLSLNEEFFLKNIKEIYKIPSEIHRNSNFIWHFIIILIFSFLRVSLRTFLPSIALIQNFPNKMKSLK